MYKINFMSRLAHSKSLLAFMLCWLFGLFAGTCLAAELVPIDSTWMRGLVCSPVSIPGTIASALLPFLLSAYAAAISRRLLIYVVCLCKAVLFSFVGQAVFQTFGSAGWLMRSIFLFPHILSVTALLLFCLRRLFGKIGLRRDFWIGIGVLLFAAAVDYFFVSPFLRKLFELI